MQLQCKDIGDEEFLDAVRTAARLGGIGPAMSWDVGCVLAGHPEHIGQSLAHVSYPGKECFPWRLVRAKAKKLIDRGRLDGCPCGCRGDYRVVEDQLPSSSGRVLIAPLADGPWGERGWRELGWTTEEDLRPSQPPFELKLLPALSERTLRSMLIPVAISAGNLTAAFCGMGEAIRAAGSFRRINREQEKRIRASRLRSQYRQKRGRRQYR